MGEEATQISAVKLTGGPREQRGQEVGGGGHTDGTAHPRPWPFLPWLPGPRAPGLWEESHGRFRSLSWTLGPRAVLEMTDTACGRTEVCRVREACTAEGTHA